MVSTSIMSAFLAASILSMASSQSIPTPTYTGALNAMTDEGCYNTGEPLEDHGSYTFQTAGNCQPICVGLQKPVMALVNGSNCWCGDLLPPKAAKVDSSNCDTPCNGYNLANCGGNNFWAVSLTGLNHNSIANYDPSAASSSAAAAASKTSVPAAVVTVGGSTVVITATGSAGTKGTNASSSSPNKAGIAAGVVVGVVALVGIIGGVFLFLRQKHRREVEEEYRRQAAVNSFVTGGKLHTSSSSMNDSRLDPEVMMRRQSDGSIADNQDYSRRILKVTNPDGH